MITRAASFPKALTSQEKQKFGIIFFQHSWRIFVQQNWSSWRYSLFTCPIKMSSLYHGTREILIKLKQKRSQVFLGWEKHELPMQGRQIRSIRQYSTQINLLRKSLQEVFYGQTNCFQSHLFSFLSIYIENSPTTFHFVENKNVKLFLKMLKQDFASIFRNKSQTTCTVSAFLCQFYCICTDIIKHSIWQNLNISNS